MKICGIDLSMTSPAICVSDTEDFKNAMVFFYTPKKKFQHSWGNIHGMTALKYKTAEERYDNLSEWVMNILRKLDVTHVCIEGYSMGSKSGLVLNIAENGGLLKHKMWKEGIEFINPAPTSVKKFFTGKGNANKILMHESFVSKTGVDVSRLLDSKIDGNPVSDIVDSYAMMLYGFEHFK